MSDQAQQLRKKVNQNKLSSVIDDIKNINDIHNVYSTLVQEIKSTAKVLNFISAKGGVGKTYILSCFAYFLRTAGKSPAIIDLNKYYPDTTLYFSNQHQVKLTKDTILDNSCFQHKAGGDETQIIFTIDSDIKGMEARLFKIGLQQAKLAHYDYILVDIPIASIEFILSCIQPEDINYFITDCDYASFYNLSDLLRNLNSALQTKSNAHIIFNQSDGNIKDYYAYFEETFKTKENFFFKTTLNIADDRILNRLNKSAYNLKEIAKHSLSSREIERYIQKLITIESSPKKIEKQSFFNKISGIFNK